VWRLQEPGGFPSVLVPPVTSREQALEAIREIAEQGEGGTNDPRPSHFTRLFEIYQQFPETDPDQGAIEWVATRAAPVDPNTLRQPDAGVAAGTIRHPRSRGWAELFDLRYRMLLAGLSHVLQLDRGAAGGAERSAFLVGQSFSAMFRMTALADLLLGLPLRADGGPERAGPPFELPYTLALPQREADRWRLHLHLRRLSLERIAELRPDAPDAEGILLNALEVEDGTASGQIRTLLGEPAEPQEPAREIQEVRILPALAIARFGSSADPMDNYDLRGRAGDPAGFRELVPAETLVVDRGSGEIVASTVPARVSFRDATGAIRPVAPFFEVWARFQEDGPLEPLTRAHLSDPADVTWRVRVGNRKLSRRTGDPGDRIEADSEPFSDHAARALEGRAGNFRDGKSVPLGSVQYLRPTEAFPEVRLRFSPGPGNVYGHRAGDPNTVDAVYDPARGRWDNHNDGSSMLPPGTPLPTRPIQIYARDQRPGPNQGRNLGYLDDSCDGILEVEVRSGGRTFTSFARVTVGPPDFAPDSSHPRTVADEIEQMLLGPAVSGPVEAEAAIDVVRRALETMRLMNSEDLNITYGQGTFAPAQAEYVHARDRHADVLRTLEGLNSPAGSPERNAAVGALGLVLSMLRSYDSGVFDPSPAVAQQMPALMRGSDGLNLALTRRQRSLIEKAARDFGQQPGPQAGNAAERDMIRLIQTLSFHANRHLRFEVDGGRRLSDLFGDPPALLQYLRTATARGAVAGALLGRPLVVPGDPGASAFVALLAQPSHPMHAAFQQTDPATGKVNLDIVRDWIRSLR
jgi:Ferritin-like